MFPADAVLQVRPWNGNSQDWLDAVPLTEWRVPDLVKDDAGLHLELNAANAVALGFDWPLAVDAVKRQRELGSTYAEHAFYLAVGTSRRGVPWFGDLRFDTLDAIEFDFWQGNGGFGVHWTLVGQGEVVPEPSAIALWFLCFGLLACRIH